MEQYEPEIVQPIVAQRQGDDRASAFPEKHGSIEIRMRQMLQNYQDDACLVEVVAGMTRTVVKDAQGNKCFDELFGERLGVEPLGVPISEASTEYLEAPTEERVAIELRIQPHSVVLAQGKLRQGGESPDTANEPADCFLGFLANPSLLGPESAKSASLLHLPHGEPGKVHLGQAFWKGLLGLPDENVSRNSNVLVEGPDHGEGELTFSREHL